LGSGAEQIIRETPVPVQVAPSRERLNADEPHDVPENLVLLMPVPLSSALAPSYFSRH